MNVGDFLDDFEQEIGDGGPQIAINREQMLKDYIDSKKNPETVKKTKREVATLQKWLQGQQEDRPIEDIEPGTLNILLGLYLISTKKKDGGDYEPTSLNSIFASIKRYLEEKNYKENIVTSDLFKGTRDALASKKKELKAMGMGNTPNKVNNFLEKKEVKYTKCHIPFYLPDVMLKYGDKNATSPQKSLPS